MIRILATLGTCACFCAAAQAASLSPNGTVAGTWGPGDQQENGSGRYLDSYALRVPAGQMVTVGLTSSVDTYLLVDTADGNRLTDDDGGGGTNSQIVLPAGTYTVIATTYGGGNARPGQYQITTSAMVMTPINDNGTIAGNWGPGDTQIGDSQSYIDTYSITLSPNSVAIIDLTSQVDTYLRARDTTTGSEISDDDGGDGSNARLIIANGDAQSTWLVSATTFGNDAQVGQYQLTTSVKVPGGEIQRFDGSIDATDHRGVSGRLYDTVNLNLHSDEVYLLQLQSESFDTYLGINGPEGFHTSDDDGGEGTNSQIVLVPPVTGLYQLMPASYSYQNQGAYQFSVSRLVPGIPIPPATQGAGGGGGNDLPSKR